MKPSEKSNNMEEFLEKQYERSTYIRQNTCNPYIGCGKPIDEFRDELSLKEFTISGLCQNCQDSIFGV